MRVSSFTLLADHPAEAGQASPALELEVRESLHDERDLRRIEVSVEGAEATLTGRVETFWDKDRAIKRALDVDGVETVVSRA